MNIEWTIEVPMLVNYKVCTLQNLLRQLVNCNVDPNVKVDNQ